jgi:hypothetical protein
MHGDWAGWLVDEGDLWRLCLFCQTCDCFKGDEGALAAQTYLWGTNQRRRISADRHYPYTEGYCPRHECQRAIPSSLRRPRALCQEAGQTYLSTIALALEKGIYDSQLHSEASYLLALLCYSLRSHSRSHIVGAAQGLSVEKRNSKSMMVGLRSLCVGG